MVRSPPPPAPPSLPADPAPVPWSPSIGHRKTTPVLRLGLEQGDAETAVRTPEELRQLIEQHQRRGVLHAILRRTLVAIALALAVGAGALWASGQAWWSPTLLAHLPEPAPMAQWLRRPNLGALPGLPAEWNPWAQLTLEEPETALTRWKIGRLEGEHAACQTWLDAAPDSDLAPLQDRVDAGTLLCGWTGASRISQLDGVRFSSPFPLACGAAVALARWERHTLQPAARKHLGSEVVRIEHLGSYACRNIGSGADGGLSTHASANALDIGGFTLANGQSVRVASDWRPADATAPSAKAAFLHAALDGACSHFNAALGPDYNAAHRDHFHLDRGTSRVCR